MKNKATIFLSYFPVILVLFQVMANLLFFISRNLYMDLAFYLSTFFGTNVLFALFLLVFTFKLKFCFVSRAAAIAEFLFAIIYLIRQVDDVYNVLMQVIVGSVALVWTFRMYIKKFPLCRLSLFITFLGSVFSSGSCKKGLDKWEEGLKETVLKHHHIK